VKFLGMDCSSACVVAPFRRHGDQCKAVIRQHRWTHWTETCDSPVHFLSSQKL